jgi:hypothetical protein
VPNFARPESPLPEGLKRGVIKKFATRALFHLGGRDPTGLLIDFHYD